MRFGVMDNLQDIGPLEINSDEDVKTLFRVLAELKANEAQRRGANPSEPGETELDAWIREAQAERDAEDGA